MRATLVLAGLAMAMAGSPESMFSDFKQKYGKVYANAEEEATRFAAFKENLAKVAASGNPTQGVTKFMDLTAKEFSSMYLMPNRGPKPSTVDAPQWDGECHACKRFPELANLKLGANSSWDWTEHGAVTAVKNQAQCGSCWTFGTTGDIEGVWYLGNNSMIPLSEQMIVSCDTSQGGCNGGWQSKAMQWIIQQGGDVAETTYPYTSGKGVTGTCETNKESPKVAKISSWFQVSSAANQEDQIERQLPMVGPITIDLNAQHMQTYQGGVDNPRLCNVKSLDHAVLIVGFGDDKGTPYWKIKNSWGPDWGENGYYRIIRGENKCGLAMNAVHSKL